VEVASVYEARGGTTDPGVRLMVENLLRQVEAGGVDYLIVRGHDRLARRPGDLARIVRRLAAAGVRLASTADPASAFSEQITLFCLVAKVNERRAA
jgi:DNA invertase Pin-like site-specific DNA recombinase